MLSYQQVYPITTATHLCSSLLLNLNDAYKLFARPVARHSRFFLASLKDVMPGSALGKRFIDIVH